MADGTAHAVSAPAGKKCVICGVDCGGRPRVKDPRGRYFCRPCYDARASSPDDAFAGGAAAPELVRAGAPSIGALADPDAIIPDFGASRDEITTDDELAVMPVAAPVVAVKGAQRRGMGGAGGLGGLGGTGGSSAALWAGLGGLVTVALVITIAMAVWPRSSEGTRGEGEVDETPAPVKGRAATKSNAGTPNAPYSFSCPSHWAIETRQIAAFTHQATMISPTGDTGVMILALVPSSADPEAIAQGFMAGVIGAAKAKPGESQPITQLGRFNGTGRTQRVSKPGGMAVVTVFVRPMGSEHQLLIGFGRNDPDRNGVQAGFDQILGSLQVLNH